MTGDLVAFLRARLDEDALWANEASRCRGNLPPDGAHWQWEDCETDQPVTVDPGADDVLFGVGLRSVEQYPYTAISGVGPQLAVSPDEIDAAVAGHIARNDPARVLAEVDAKRRILNHLVWATTPGHTVYAGPASVMMTWLAIPYRGHPDYQPAWAPGA